ncbi:arabinogalactan peptide 13 [Artemisia annua]|uniref:Arabinogalactan peptide 13 n=1 Tax=Artemisia annua TaxID=35608 RepID=A0A2U1KMV9_ARTAN|nr:arabinogalactan peptide 13 [Artemisia annua]
MVVITRNSNNQEQSSETGIGETPNMTELVNMMKLLTTKVDQLCTFQEHANNRLNSLVNGEGASHARNAQNHQDGSPSGENGFVLREKGRRSLWKKPIMLKKSRLMLNKILLTDFCCSKFVNLQHKNFRNFMRSRNHEKADEILKTVITCGEFHWKTDKRTNDCGVFVMRHMKHYMGYNILRWDCGIEDDCTKQTNQLKHGRSIEYACSTEHLYGKNIYVFHEHTMESMKMKLFVALVVMLMAISNVAAQEAPAPAPTSDASVFVPTAISVSMTIGISPLCTCNHNHE